MKGRESGMPEQAVWEGFFDIPTLLRTMELDKQVRDVAEFGCGYGTFAIPAAQVISGTLYALDIDPDMIDRMAQEAQRRGAGRIKALQRDFLAEGTGLERESIDYAMLFNILHIEQPDALLREAHRIVRPGGRCGIIHWNPDPATPRGPSMEIRPTPEQCMAWAQAAGFGLRARHDLPPYHYGLVVQKGVGGSRSRV